MPGTTMLTAPNETIEARNGIRYTYRRFGNTGTSALPLVFLQHYRGNLDNWDPVLIDTIAEQREVILLDNTGVAGSTGTVPSTVEPMAVDAVAFLDALRLARYDLFGFSLGGFVAQEVALIRPHQIRRIVLSGTAPKGGRGFHGWRGEMLAAANYEESGPENLLTLFFERTESSRAKGMEFVQRIFSRDKDRDEATDLATRDAQITAIATWGIPDPAQLGRLAHIPFPTLVANGDNDRMIPTENTYLLGRHLPNARISIYPDAGHGFLFQYPAEFGAETNEFLGQ
ncbi:Pimeloyl-ACP methyl ester carboxylesterase [Streptomyces sp. DvalAA-14]|uniref:alpha/beta fold hydrolase n=1 Tax=unclassified Streptomyces TaxID=2593676 RepID=UPI00081B1739|nr:MULTISPECIES: alpha/beta hydrolase [unclassified Streptomyces]MYS19502.1 alpha/beta fold hydrolase [Streptomyces sp. SID4948]SCD45989.1 Pimeloyl-ACP methyl ester carboxylesterase [Streptomyces sp. DvalAA-14]